MNKCALRLDAGYSFNSLSGKSPNESGEYRTLGFGAGVENCFDLPVLAEVLYEESLGDLFIPNLGGGDSSGVPLQRVEGASNGGLRQVFGVLLGTRFRFLSDWLFVGADVKALLGESNIVFNNGRVLPSGTDILFGGEIVGGGHLSLTKSFGVDLGVGAQILFSDRDYSDVGAGIRFGFSYQLSEK